MNKACFFDLDGTLIPNPSSESRLIWLLFKRLHFFVFSGIVLYFLESLFRYKNFKNSKAYYQGMKLVAIKKLVQHALRNYSNVLSKKALNYIGKAKEDGYRIYLITGAPNFIAEEVNSVIGFHRVFSTEMEIRNGKLTGRIKSTIPYSKNKIKIVKMIAQRDNIDLSNSVSFGDSIQDLHFLKATGEYFAVNPQRKLKKVVPREKVIVWD